MAGGGLRPSEVCGSSTSTITSVAGQNSRAKCRSEMSCSPVNELEKADHVVKLRYFDEHSDGLVELHQAGDQGSDFRWSQSPRLGVALQSLNAPPPVKESCSLFVCAILSFHLWYVFMYRIVPEGARMMYECVVAPKS